MKFEILTKHVTTGEELNLIYDNTTNLLTTSTGQVFQYPDRSDQLYTKIPSYEFSKEKPIGKNRLIRVLKIQLGLSCNYSCDYCSQRFVERAPETSKKDIDDFMSKLENLTFDEEAGLRIELWGGEPFVYWKTIKPLVARIHEKFASWKKKPRFSVITNGSILTPEINYWLIVNNFQVAVSHDGPGQWQRGPDPMDDPEQREIILDLYRALRPMNRFSFNSMLTAKNSSRKAIHDWFVNLTGDPDVPLGEGSLVDAYDDGGMAYLEMSKKDHFEFRKTSFNDIYSVNGQIGFRNILSKIDGFTESVLSAVPSIAVGQKCGMDLPDRIAIDLRGNVITCQNVSAVQTAPNGESHKIGTIEDIDNVKLNTARHWSERPNCADCPVLHLCQGSCMFTEGDHWERNCSKAYSENVALMALSIEKMTGGFVPVFIKPIDGKLPEDRMDIWGDILKHEENAPASKTFPIKVVSVNKKKTIINDVEVYEKSETKE